MLKFQRNPNNLVHHASTEGTGIIACNNCKLDFQSDTFTGVKKYMDRLRYHVGIQFWLGGTFGASLDYNHVHEETTNHTNIFVGLDTRSASNSNLFSLLLRAV